MVDAHHTHTRSALISNFILYVVCKYQGRMISLQVQALCIFQIATIQAAVFSVGHEILTGIWIFDWSTGWRYLEAWRLVRKFSDVRARKVLKISKSLNFVLHACDDRQPPACLLMDNATSCIPRATRDNKRLPKRLPYHVVKTMELPQPITRY